jgi:hypothetical protein
MKKILHRLIDQHSELAQRMNYSYYWEVDGHKMYNLHLVRWYEKEYNTWAKFVCTPDYMRRFREALSDKHIDMSHNYNLDMIRKLKQDYSHVSLLFSGGYDSSLVFFEFVKNGIKLDETIMMLYTEIEERFNKEFRMCGGAALEHWKHMVGEQTVLQATADDVIRQYSDEYFFFKASMEAYHMPWDMAFFPPHQHYKGASIWNPGESGITPKLEFKENSCHIKAIDKPQLFYYNKKWYVTALDSNMGTRNGLLNTIFFWLHPDNVKGLIQYARKYRDFCLRRQYDIETDDYDPHNLRDLNLKFDPDSPLSFFTLNDSIEFNHIVGRGPIYHPEAKITKEESVMGLRTETVARGRWDVGCAYAKPMGKFLEIFPECGKGFHAYNKQGKFAWIIDIDTLEIFTQEELIPNGFEGLDTVRVQGLPVDQLRKKI